MKLPLFSLINVLVSFSTSLTAQNYISFSGSGAGNTVDSVKIENLTQCTSMDMCGSDILKLVPVIGIYDIENTGEKAVHIYPNPSSGCAHVTFNSPVEADASLIVSDIGGKPVLQKRISFDKGTQSMRLIGLQRGVYFLRMAFEGFSYSATISSMADGPMQPEVAVDNGNLTNIVFSEKSIAAEIQMQYNQGDLLKFTGKSGIYRTVEMLVPVSDQTVDFEFIGCSDANGNNYAVVKIGSQWWMAENLNTGTYAPLTTPQIAGTKFCMDINGQADPSCPMGGLYEWNILMQGASSCNGTGAPPNDACPTPVKGLCPDGWHIPSHYEWSTLARNAGSNPAAFPYDMTVGILGTDEGGNLKKNCTNYWWSPNAGATNIKGFTALPGGDTWQGVFEDFGQSAYFWTSTESYGYLPWVYALNYSLSTIGRSSYVRENGFSVRCVKN